MIIGYPGYWLTEELSRAIEADLLTVQEKVFPDGELYIKLTAPEKIASQDVIVVSTLFPEQDRRLFKTLLIINAAKNAGAKKVIALIPYLAYSRQDKVFLPGEPISACLVTKSLRVAGANVLITVDVHSTRVLECFEGPVINVVVSDVLVARALSYLEKPVIIAPDKGALERAFIAARVHGLDYDYLIKQRDRVTGTVMYTPRELSIKGRDVIMVDDIISTGGTISEASKMLLENGARKVVVAATHGLLVGDAVKKLEASGALRVLLADTLGIRHEHRLIEYVSVTHRVVEELKKVL
ncbi:MAG: ribose-phosphate diphosphokinase [Desulfurococcaceae archaeon]